MSNRKVKKAIEKVKSIQEMISYMELQKKSYTSKSIIKLLKELLAPYKDANLHLLNVTMTKQDFLSWNKWKANN